MKQYKVRLRWCEDSTLTLVATEECGTVRTGYGKKGAVQKNGWKEKESMEKAESSGKQ